MYSSERSKQESRGVMQYSIRSGVGQACRIVTKLGPIAARGIDRHEI